MQAGATIHPSPTVLHKTIIVSLCPLQEAGDNADKPCLFFSFLLFPHFSTVMKDLFLLSEKKIASQRLIFSHSVLTRLTLLLSILFEWEMVYVQWGACGKS